MPLGRFAAYFCALAAVCLVAFPRAVGSVPTAAVSAANASPCLADGTDFASACSTPVPAQSASPVIGVSDVTFESVGKYPVHAGLGVRCDLPAHPLLAAAVRPVAA